MLPCLRRQRNALVWGQSCSAFLTRSLPLRLQLLRRVIHPPRLPNAPLSKSSVASGISLTPVQTLPIRTSRGRARSHCFNAGRAMIDSNCVDVALSPSYCVQVQTRHPLRIPISAPPAHTATRQTGSRRHNHLCCERSGCPAHRVLLAFRQLATEPRVWRSGKAVLESGGGALGTV